MGPVAIDETLRTLVTTREAAATIDSFRSERDRFTKQFGTDPINALWSDNPLTVTVIAQNGGTAVVKVWSQLLMGVPGGRVEALWRTQTITLAWQDSDWRVDAVARVEGPTPDVDPAALPSAGSDLAGVIHWIPAVLAGSTVQGGQ